MDVVQTTYNLWDWLLPLISGAIGALIGTYVGAFFLHWKKEKKIKNVRKIAIKSLDIFKEYASQKKTYTDSANEFNNKLNISEKRAIVVALHKLGVPFDTLMKESFDIKNLKFKNHIIDKDEIKAMTSQIEKGNCDNLFFMDVESYFMKDLRLNAVRYIGKRYVEEVHAKSRVDKNKPDTIINPTDWFKNFSPGELQTILVLRTQLANTDYFNNEGIANPKMVKNLLIEIEIGIWDNYLFYEFESFANIRAQHNLATVVQNMIKLNQQQINNNPHQTENLKSN